MAEYMRKDVFLSSMGLTGDETKYGNHDAEHQQRSYSTYMSYEIMDSVDDSIVEEELVPVRHGRWVKIYENGEPAIQQHQVGVFAVGARKCQKIDLLNLIFAPTAALVWTWI